MCQIPDVPQKLRDFFEEHGRVALAFSGGTDSTYLLHAAVSSGAEVSAYTVRTAFQTPEETERAARLAELIGARHTVLDLDILFVPGIRENPEDRCYLCKKAVFSAISGRALSDGFTVVIDGTNASDDFSERPGMRALVEMGILSPLRSAGITKAQVRTLSKAANLPTWNMNSNSCLATRVPCGTVITEDLLGTVESCEKGLFAMGFSDFRVRTDGNSAILETTGEQRQLLEERKADVESLLLKYHSSVSYSERTPRQ